MLERIIKYAGILPLFAIGVYILGYISLNSYLTSFGVSEDVGLDFKIIKLGILLSFIIGPVVLLCYSDFKFGDYTNADPDVSSQLINTLNDALGYTIFYSLALANVFAKPSFDSSTIVMLWFLVIATVLNKLKLKPKIAKSLKAAFILIPFFILTFILIGNTNSVKNSLYFAQIGVFTTCASLRIFNKEGITFQLSKLGIIVTTICYTCTLFGAFMIGKIPSEYGGEKKPIHTYYINNADSAKINITPLKQFLKNNKFIRLQAVYDNTEKIYFRTSTKKLIAIPKSFIIGEEIDIPSGYGN